MAPRRPGLLDRLDLLALRMVKAGRAKHTTDDTFYEGFFTEDDVEKYLGDVRNCFRFRRVGEVYRALFGDGAARVADIGAGLGIARRFLPPDADYLGVECSAHSIALATRIGKDWAYLDVEDAALWIRRIEPEGPRLRAQLASGEWVEVDPSTLAAGADDALYARVRGERARLTRAAQVSLSDCLREDGDGFLVQLGEETFRIRRDGGPEPIRQA